MIDGFMQTRVISVIGLGYIGLPTAALLANNGYTVVGSDVNERVVKLINQGKTHIVEPGLDAFVRSAITAGGLQAFTKPQAGDVYIICVPTPFYESNGVPQPNIDNVLTATRNIAPLVKAGDLVILESTSPVGTTEALHLLLRDEGVNVDEIYIGYCPERVLPGKILTELVENDRIVGGITSNATAEIAEFYRSFVRGEVLESDSKTSEMCKLVENSFRDVNIAFANELSVICERKGIDVWDLIRLANRHPRVNILNPGVGVGGHCIAVDPWFIVASDERNAQLIRTAREVNDNKPEWVIEKIKLAAAEVKFRTGTMPKVVCLGLAFKPDIDDLRHSPSLQVAMALLEQGYDIAAVEPNIATHDSLPLSSIDAALEESNVIAILVQHREFMPHDVRKKLQDLGALDFCGALV